MTYSNNLKFFLNRLHAISYNCFILNNHDDFLMERFKLKNCKRENSLELIKISSSILHVYYLKFYMYYPSEHIKFKFSKSINHAHAYITIKVDFARYLIEYVLILSLKTFPKARN